MLLFFLAHSLVGIPFYLWKYADNELSRFDALTRVARVYADKENAKNELEECASVCFYFSKLLTNICKEIM